MVMYPENININIACLPCIFKKSLEILEQKILSTYIALPESTLFLFLNNREHRFKLYFLDTPCCPFEIIRICASNF